MPKHSDQDAIVATWPLPYAATLGSAVRIKGILQYIRTRLPSKSRKQLDVRAGELVLFAGDGDSGPLQATIGKALHDIDARPVIPREIEDILSISSTERHRWLKDGRLPSAGTRTVKLHGRARKITFHVFDPPIVQDLANRDAVVDWREQDAEAAAERRRQAAWAAKHKRSEAKKAPAPPSDPDRPNLRGWDEFERDGPLRERT